GRARWRRDRARRRRRREARCGSWVDPHFAARHRVGRLKRRNLDRRERLIGLGRGAIRRVSDGRLAPRQPLARLQPRPALFVRGDEIDVEMQRLDTPDAVGALLVRVLIYAVAPFGVLFVLAEHAEIAPAGGGALPVLRHGNRRLERDPFVELTVDQPLLPAVKPLQVFADAFLAGVDAIDPDLDRAVIGEQVGGFAPQAAIDVVAERALELLDSANALELCDPRGERVDLRVDALSVSR